MGAHEGSFGVAEVAEYHIRTSMALGQAKAHGVPVDVSLQIDAARRDIARLLYREDYVAELRRLQGVETRLKGLIGTWGIQMRKHNGSDGEAEVHPYLGDCIEDLQFVLDPEAVPPLLVPSEES